MLEMEIQGKQRILNAGLLFAAVLLMTLSVFRYLEESPKSAYNKARVLLAEEKGQIADNLIPDSAYTYYILDLEGRVMAENGSGYQAGQGLNLEEAVQTDNSYYKENRDKVKVTFPILREGKAAAFAVFILNKEMVLGRTKAQGVWYVFSPAGLALLLFLLAGIGKTEYLGRRILKPMKEISRSADAIVKGNYGIPVVGTDSTQVCKSQIDKLSYDFERMREELLDRVEKEARLKRAQKELMSCISHDLKTPISTIKAYSEGLRDGLARDEESRTAYISTIIRKTEVLSDMIKELLDQTNAEINELSIRKTEQYTGEYFARLTEELKVYCIRQGVRLFAEDHAPDLLAEFDGDRITQVVFNLMDNAVKYMDKAEKCISFTVEYEKRSQMIYVTVRDNGPGIGITDIPYVFEKFYRAEKSRSMCIPGAGLGLSICKYIVENHGGEIRLESRSGEGCAFTFGILV